jgi:DNA invertase Pin-like site-specific DNA recombinase
MRKKKRQRFRAVQAIKAAAREKIGSPPPTRREPQHKKPQEQKHKPTLGDLLGEE